jgi:hypothetical protein
VYCNGCTSTTTTAFKSRPAVVSSFTSSAPIPWLPPVTTTISCEGSNVSCSQLLAACRLRKPLMRPTTPQPTTPASQGNILRETRERPCELSCRSRNAGSVMEGLKSVFLSTTTTASAVKSPSRGRNGFLMLAMIAV